MSQFEECFSANQNAGFQSHRFQGESSFYTQKLQDRLDKLCSALAVA